MSLVSKRGRPPGSSRLNAGDDLALRQTADRLILDNTLKLTPAMRAVGIADETVQRRLRRKWKGHADRYLREAVERRHATQLAAFENGLRQVVMVAGQVGLLINDLVREGAARFQRWSDANPEAAANLMAVAERYRTLQIDGRAKRV